jgi:hypothetical protein
MIKLVTQHSYLKRIPTRRWLDFKTTHQLDDDLHMPIH